jgi:hypothetical protein
LLLATNHAALATLISASQRFQFFSSLCGPLAAAAEWLHPRDQVSRP